MKITRSRLKELVRETMNEDGEYQAFFKKSLEKTGKSIPSMSDEEKKAFFNKIDAAWKGKGEKKESVTEAVGNDSQMNDLHKTVNNKKFMSKATEQDFLDLVNHKTKNYFKSGIRNKMLKKIYQDYSKNPGSWKYDDGTYRLEESITEASNGGFPAISSENDLLKLIQAMAKKSKKFAEKVNKEIEPYARAAGNAVRRQ